MTTSIFTLIAEGPDLQSDDPVDDVFEAGCDDGLVGRSGGIQFVDFDHKADTLYDAVRFAIAELQSVAGVTVVRPAPSAPESGT